MLPSVPWPTSRHVSYPDLTRRIGRALRCAGLGMRASVHSALGPAFGGMCVFLVGVTNTERGIVARTLASGGDLVQLQPLQCHHRPLANRMKRAWLAFPRHCFSLLFYALLIVVNHYFNGLFE